MAPWILIRPAWAAPTVPQGALNRQVNNSASCDDGLFCNGADTCSCGSCAHAGDPCTYPAVCYEDTNACSTREVEMTLGFGSGAIGTANRQVNVQLKNTADFVSGIQMTVCDENDCLIATGCTVATAFDANFDCTVNELSNGCASAVLVPVGSATINPSSTMRTIFNIGFDVSPSRTRSTACTDCGTDCYLPGSSCAAGSANCYRYDRNKLCNCVEEGCYSLEEACPVVDTGDIWVTIEDALVLDPWNNTVGALADGFEERQAAQP